jgi:hypothetical protein
MWHGFIGQRIAATTKTLRRLSMGLLLAALALGLYDARTFVNVMQGPVQIDDTRLAAITDPTFELHNYATVQGTNTVSTGITAIEKTTRNGVVESQRTTGEFMAMIVGKHILVVKTKVGETAQKYTGGIVPLPDDVKKEVVSDMADPNLQAATLPVMLDATGSYGDDLILGYGVIGALVLAGLWTLIQSQRRTEMPERHPLCKALSEYGPLHSVVPQIDGEFSTANSTLGGATFTRNWVISCWLTKTLVMRRDEIIWVYKKRTKHSVNFIPTGTTYGLILRDTRGSLLEISNSEQYVNKYLSSLAEQTPWVIFGYDPKVEKLYKKQRQSFRQTVAERKAAMETART